jgi:hypothetical protein
MLSATKNEAMMRTDQEVIETALRAKNGERFLKVWNGEYSDFTTV